MMRAVAVLHMVRVCGHRAFCISRGEAATLPAFDENAYVAATLELKAKTIATR